MIYKLLLLIAMAVNASAATIAIPCTFTDIKTALLTAAEGDTIIVGPGSCVWASQIDLLSNKSFTFKGSGTNQTTLVSASLSYCLGIDTTSTNLFTVSDFNCVGHANNSGGFFATGNNPPAVPTKGPTHFYNLQMTNVLYRGLTVGYTDSFGLIDHCYFKSMPGNPQMISFGGNEYNSWSTPNPIGTTNACYVEDCVFDNGSNAGNGFFDSYNGSQLVWRYNFCSGNAPSGVHGYDSQYTSARTWEIYNNVFTNITPIVLAIELRGGTGVVFSNTVYGASGLCQLAYYRSCMFAHEGTATELSIPGQGRTVHFQNNPSANDVVSLGFSNYKFVRRDPSLAGDVLRGKTTSISISNLMSAINLGPGGGITYALATQPSFSFRALDATASDLILTNKLDGNTDQFGYPANQQPGVLGAYKYGVSPQLLLPCYSWGNICNGTNDGFSLKDDSDICNHYVTNLVKLNRDYFNDSPMPGYTPLVYPHPLNNQH